MQARSAPRVPTSRLGGQALVPDMLYPLLGAFNPNNARIPTPSGVSSPQTDCRRPSRLMWMVN